VSVEAAAAGELTTPGLARRLACLLYEGVLLFGVVMLAGLLYGVVTQQRHALVGSAGLQAFLVLVLGLYFVYFWSRTGQTLAMLTWHIRLVDLAGHPVSRGRAALRYLLCWIWFLPALAAVHLAGLKGGWPITATVLAGMAGYAALQYWHDAICRTRLVTWRPTPKKP
jgi:uncharacterized RDD family membrane protein YckC